MKSGKTLCFVVTSLALACAQAAPDIQTTLFLGNNTQGIATDPALAKAYVTNFDDHTVSAIDMQTLTVVATINVAPKQQSRLNSMKGILITTFTLLP